MTTEQEQQINRRFSLTQTGTGVAVAVLAFLTLCGIAITQKCDDTRIDRLEHKVRSLEDWKIRQEAKDTYRRCQ